MGDLYTLCGFSMVHGFRKSLLTLISTSKWIILSILFLMTGQGSGQICNTPNWREFGNNQYRFVNHQGRTWDDAKDYCRSQGGDLAVITSHEQNSFLNTYTSKRATGYNYWIGLSDIDGDRKYTWVNNTPSGFSNFRPQGVQGGCVRLTTTHSGQWEGSGCSDGRVHICQRDSDPRCSWHQYGQSFYRFMGIGRNFDSAEIECANIGGRLAVIRSTEINRFLESFVTPALPSPNCYWFGLSQSSNGEPFLWNDGINLSDPQWAPDEPSRSTGRSCGCLWSDGNNDDNHGRWDSRDCQDALPYICERPQIPLNGKWIEIAAVKDVQYYFSTFSSNFFNANEYCRQIGGHLAQLKTSTIHTAVTSQFGDMMVDRFFFGLDDLSNENDFRWADGTLLSKTGYSPWNGPNPDNYEGYEHCVERNHNGGWNDRYCSDRERFVCEKPEVPPLRLIAMTSAPFGGTGNTPSFSCIISSDNPQNYITYSERVVRPSLTPGGYTLNVPGSEATLTGRLTQNLPAGATSVGVYKCSTTSTITGASTSADVTILSQDRRFQPSNGRLTKTVYPGDNITLSVSTTDSYSSGTGEIRWSTFSNFAEGSLSPSGDGVLSYTIRSASKSDADVYGTFQNNAVDNRLYSLIRVIVSECPRGRWNLPLCNRLCDNCYNGGICHPQSGTCICPPGFMGKNCLSTCGKHQFGWECEMECGVGNVLDACSGSQICLPDPYGCNCLSGYTGINCDEECPQGKFGVDCLQDCHCAAGMPCDAFTGECEGSCEDGWSGEGCQVPPICPVGYYGINCTEFCNCPDLSECEKDSGFCTSSEGQCEIGFVAESPEKPDRCATFAGCFESCSKTCHCAATVTCDDESGSCTSCHPRWSGDNCQTDRFTATREKTNPGTAIISCTFDADSDGSLSMRASIGDFSAESFVTATSTDTSDGSSLQSNFTLSIDDIETKTIYCFVGSSTSDDGFAYISLLPQGTFVLPVFNSKPRLAEQGHNYLVIGWDSWNPVVDVGDGPVIGYKVYVNSSDGNETVTFITASGVPREMSTSRRKREDPKWMNSPMVRPPRNLPSRKKRQGDAGTLTHYVTGLEEGQSYLIRISAVRDGLNGEGEKGPVLSVTTRKIEPPPGPSSTGAIVGGAVGGIIFIVLLIVIIIIVLRWRRKPRPKPVSYSYNNDYIGGISTEDETGKSDTPKSTDTLKSTPKVTPNKPAVRPKPSIAAELPVTSNGVDLADVPVSRSEEAPKERHPIPISQFATLVQNNRYTDMFYEEFHCLPEANIFPQTIAKKKINFEKNRYKNILPYDSSRVVLPIINGDPESHYFNASYLPSFGNEHAYIASQGPNNASMIDFWRMVWQENVKTIAMVTNLQEGNKIKCRQYWPESKSVAFGEILVKLESVTNCTGGLKRTMYLTKGADTKVVNQFHFTQWPDKAVPNSTTALLSFIDEVQKDHIQNDSPLLVHCSAGVGRTGVVLSIDSVVAEAKRTNQVDIFGYVSKMRQRRPYMVQTQEQYKFVYIAVLEALLSENTRIQACYFESALMKLQVVTRNKKGMSTLLATQFQNLTIVCPDPPAAMVRTGTQAENRSKSRYANILPLERNRVILQSKSSSDSDFINASFVRGLRYGFITTQMPMPNTVCDFWSMVIDYQPAIIVMLNNDSRDKSCAQYWFDNSVTTFGSVSVTTLSVCEREGFIIRELQATRDNSQVCHVVKQYQFLEWPTKAKQQRDRAKSLLDFIGEVEDSFSDISEEFPVVVHCLNGVGRTGVFCTTLECIKQLNTEDAVDIFQMVKMLRNERTHFVQTEEEYTFIHELINEYLHENDYEQLPVPVEDDEHTYGNVESTAAPDVTGEGVYEIASIQGGAGNRPVSYRNLAGIDDRQSVAAAEQTTTEERTAQPPRDDVYENVNYR